MLFLFVCCRRAARAAGGVRGGGEARARLLADKREPHQILLLEKLSLVHREQTYTGLVQQEHPQTTNEYKHRRNAGLGAVQDQNVAAAGVPPDIQGRHGLCSYLITD